MFFFRMLVTVSGFILFMISTRSLQTSSTVLSQHETEIDLGYSERPSFSVGFNLGPSSGSVVVNLGNNSIVVERVDGSDAYHEVMAKLSLPSSQHLAYESPQTVSRKSKLSIIAGLRTMNPAKYTAIGGACSSVIAVSA